MFNSIMHKPAAMCVALALVFNAVAALAISAPNDPPDLGATPPDLTQSVDPNIVVTFDDSGSMAWTHMGDFRPYDPGATTNSSWNGPFRCANVIDPRIAAVSASASNNAKLNPMNGVAYNPKISYTPPLKEDGTAFPNADATLTAVWQDGIAVNRPLGAVAAGAAGFNDNPDGSASANSGAVTNLMGGYLKQTGSTATCVGQPGSCSCVGSGSSKVCTTDNRWQCGAAGTSDGKWTAARAVQNPFDGTVADPDTGAKPNGGPVYYRLLSTVTFSAGTDLGALGQFTASGLAKLYNAANWEAVAVPASQYQNFANWYAYYRYRNLMARTSMSRVFGVIGTPISSNIRIAWQNLNNSTYLLPASTIITNLQDNAGSGCNLTSPSTVFGAGAAPACYRGAFFNWLYQVPASNSTPSRSAAIRAGDFFKRGNTSNLLDPYWEPLTSGGQELACRQNFHLLMTDGLYNQPAVNVAGSGSTTSATQPLGPPPDLGNWHDTTTYNVGAGVSPTSIYNGFATDSDTGSTYSDIAFYYWANNLRPDLRLRALPAGNDKVPAYFPDLTVGVTGPAGAIVDPTDPGKTDEVFWNPLNDPATWPHVVQFAVTLGAFGVLSYSTDMDCNVDDGFGIGNDDLCKLRTGAVNTSGVAGWPRPNGAGSGIAANIDDLWHAALNSRGAFFVATDPSSLVQHLSDIIASIAARTQSSTSESVSTSILNQVTFGYAGGYDSGRWQGYLYKFTLDPATAVATSATWDAGCILTGGAFTAIAPSTVKPPGGSCKVTPTPVPPPRIIFTSVGSGSLTGKPFTWATLTSAEQTPLNLDPNTTDPNASTGNVTGTSDGNGTDRVSYLRGLRDNETTPTTETTPRTFRIRKSLLGPIVSAQPVYEGGPSSGLSDVFPPNSAEELAARPCLTGLATAGCNSYEKFVNTYLNRNPLVYAAANDGMLHAFDAVTGSEQWAYVPHTLYANGQLGQLTNPRNTLITTVDDQPIISDMFINGSWRTILIGSLRLGGRGIFALDITDQSKPADENAAATKFMWEFSSANDPDLGYTYASANTARLHNGKWVVLLSSGYFPQKLQVRSATFGLNGTVDTAPAATANVTHFWVLDASNGSVIRKLDTPAGVTSYGLSTPGVVDFNLDQIDEVAAAGDLAGNLWRFDLSDPSPSNWIVDNMFRTYTSSLPCASTNTVGVGCEPISVQPVAFGDPVTRSVIYVFGSGEYLGQTDRTSGSVLGTNHFFGVRDYGAGSAKYPLLETDLVTQTLSEDASKHRLIVGNPVPNTKAGWMIPLNVSGVQGERDVVTIFPIFPINAAILTSLIPGSNNDPCTPGRLGAVMAVDAATGGPLVPPTTVGTPVIVGTQVNNPPAVGGVSVLSVQGGGGYFIPGVGVVGAANAGNGSVFLNFGTIWRRTSWRELLNNL